MDFSVVLSGHAFYDMKQFYYSVSLHKSTRIYLKRFFKRLGTFIQARGFYARQITAGFHRLHDNKRLSNMIIDMHRFQPKLFDLLS